MSERTYVAVDLKSFYASAECVEHGFPPLSTHLVVADQSRTDKTICLGGFSVAESIRVAGAVPVYSKSRRSSKRLMRHVGLLPRAEY